ncbi:DNA mismatch repair protein MutS, partial [Halobacteriales archaeon SW_7_68_16]
MATGIVGEFLDLKSETRAEVLMMQVGDFYELFADDAELVADELDLTVSEKSSGGETFPMAGVPLSEVTPYVRALVERGYTVAVADQAEAGDGHERSITRVASPGTLLETTDADARYLAAIVETDDGYGVAFADVTTGRFVVRSAPDRERALSDCYRFDPVEILPGPDARDDDDLLAALRTQTDATLTVQETDAFAPGRARHAVREQFGEGTIESVGLDPATIRAAGAIVSYVETTGTGVLASMTRIRTGRADVSLDATTQRNLELVETMRGDAEGSLYDTIDGTVTAAGGRLLREWLTNPIRDPDRLERRHAAVEALSADALGREALRETLADAYDLARLASRTASGSTDTDGLLRIRDTLALVPEVADAIGSAHRLADSPVATIIEGIDHAAATALRAELDEALREAPDDEGGVRFRRGYDDDLDAVLDRQSELETWLDDLEGRIKREHGLRHVTVDRNKTDGYYIQIGKSETDAVPDSFERIKTLKNSERYTTDRLDEVERDLLRAEERRVEIEQRLVAALREAGDR